MIGRRRIEGAKKACQSLCRVELFLVARIFQGLARAGIVDSPFLKERQGFGVFDDPVAGRGGEITVGHQGRPQARGEPLGTG